MQKPFKKLLVIDFETVWCRKSGYSLSVMTTEEYIRDPRFKAWGVCVREYGTNDKTKWYSHSELPALFASYDWDTTAVLAQNSQFDASILEWIYDVHPCFIFDTLSMARAVRGTEIGNSLKKMAQMFNLPDKGEELALSEGYFNELPRDIEAKLAGYCMHDVFLCEAIFNKLIAMDVTPYAHIVAGQDLEVPEWLYPTKELRLIDMTMKMYSRPMLELDQNMLTDALHEEKEKREALLERLGVSDKDLASNDRFAEILRGLGMEPPTKKKKPTVKTPKPTGVNFAFAKTDAMFQAMLNGDNEDVALVCQARLSVKSTTERTRAQRFLDISGRGTLPVPLSYYGAQTGRWTACLVAETEVIVYDRCNGQCTKRIVDVLPDDLVWDGVDFVQHEGVQFSGYKEVITYDGITGTPDHKVFLDDATTVSLFDASTSGARVMDAAAPDSRAVEAARKELKRLRW